jgi:NADPH-dependent 2,4-dienoyl-CoA reductase/sulfur reductase-like enzyme
VENGPRPQRVDRRTALVSGPPKKMPETTEVSPARSRRVLILGGGFAGIGAAQKLKDAEADVVLVDRHDYHTFQPLLYGEIS